MTLNAKSLNELNSYSDTEGMGSYNFPCGSISFDATSAVSGNGSYTAVLTNTSPSGTIGSFYGIGLLIIYHDPNGKPFEYWVNEGCDLICAGPLLHSRNHSRRGHNHHQLYRRQRHRHYGCDSGRPDHRGSQRLVWPEFAYLQRHPMDRSVH